MNGETVDVCHLCGDVAAHWIVGQDPTCCGCEHADGECSHGDGETVDAAQVARRVMALADELGGWLTLWAEHNEAPDATVMGSLARVASRVHDQAGWLARQAGVAGIPRDVADEYAEIHRGPVL